MEEIPDFWRTEVFHPLSVHFPIALLVVAFLFKVVALKYSREVWERGGTVLLIAGVVTVWIAIFTGNLADGVVSRKICDPTVLKDHENLAWTTAWLFSAGLGVDLLRQLKYPIFRNLLFRLLMILLLAIGTGTLAYTGHLGATLVYQQAAGVYTPSGNCAEFE
ncbi:DUF2231 domain-containing protein [Salinimicrobium sp. TH3]|uniref:DUF2231 domain-containing protein n=1 Tax=Salinimicrobium sp. TH3 TaxID=2997342 RepID=UPI002274E11C|nr:DUF2231 domain-containing protein [Salinimicrobium sp. TH3]MCY2688687.1 hypothetical protein [Salinimicrobium sp. TH3]